MNKSMGGGGTDQIG